MEKREYNGWYNYETWLANLWFDNDGTNEYFSEEADRIIAGTEGTPEDRREETAEALAEIIEAHVEENLPEGLGESGLFVDMLNAALKEINYREIAEHYAEDAEIPAEETDDE